MANIFGKRKIEPFFLPVFFLPLTESSTVCLVDQGGRQAAGGFDAISSIRVIWCDDLNSSFSFALSFFHFSAFSFFRLHFLKQSFANFRILFLVVSCCFTHSVSQSVCCALSLHCRPSAFCVIAQQQQKLLLLVSFCWTTALRFAFFFHSVFQVSSQFSFRSTFGTPTRCC